MTKAQSLLKALQDAEILFFQAQERCPHWDMETDGERNHSCCFDLAEARLVRVGALRAYNRSLLAGVYKDARSVRRCREARI